MKNTMDNLIIFLLGIALAGPFAGPLSTLRAQTPESLIIQDQKKLDYLSLEYGFTADDFRYLAQPVLKMFSDPELMREVNAYLKSIEKNLNRLDVVDELNEVNLEELRRGAQTALTSRTINPKTRAMLGDWLGILEWLKGRAGGSLDLITLEDNGKLYAIARRDLMKKAGEAGLYDTDGILSNKFDGKSDKNVIQEKFQALLKNSIVESDPSAPEPIKITVPKGFYGRIVPLPNAIPYDPKFQFEGKDSERKYLEYLAGIYKSLDVGRETLEAIHRCEGNEPIILRMYYDNDERGNEGFYKLGGFEQATKIIGLNSKHSGNAMYNLGTLSHEMRHHYVRSCFPGIADTQEEEIAHFLEEIRTINQYRNKYPREAALMEISHSKLARAVMLWPFGKKSSFPQFGPSLRQLWIQISLEETLAQLEEEPSGVSKAYSNLPTAQNIFDDAYLAYQSTCAANAQSEQCLDTAKILDNIVRWKNEDIAYKNRVGRELGIKWLQQ